MVAIRIGFVSRREEESVLLAERLMDEIESWNSGVQILAEYPAPEQNKEEKKAKA